MKFILKITAAEWESIKESMKAEKYYYNIGEVIREAYLRGDLNESK